MTIRIMYCTECRTYTNHAQMKSGEWVCRCATIHPAETWTIGGETLPNDPKWDEGTDNTLRGSLDDAGFGSAGPM